MELLRAKSREAPAAPVSVSSPAPPPSYLYGKSPEPSSFSFLTQFQGQQPECGPECLETPEDWAMMYRYKTLPCEENCKRIRDCWFYHNNYDCRRVPAFDEESGWFNYFSKKCVVVKWHSGCGYAHNTFELSFHPLLYRTKLCRGDKFAGFCSIFGRFCGYAHTSQELRYPSIVYPLQPLCDETESQSVEKEVGPPPGFYPLESGEEDQTISPEGLLCLARTRGALEARLKQIQTLSARRIAELRCASCRQDSRMFLLSICGHSLCFLCEQKRTSACPACGVSGSAAVSLQVD